MHPVLIGALVILATFIGEALGGTRTAAAFGFATSISIGYALQRASTRRNR
jgi:hypothetical protein